MQGGEENKVPNMKSNFCFAAPDMWLGLWCHCSQTKQVYAPSSNLDSPGTKAGLCRTDCSTWGSKCCDNFRELGWHKRRPGDNNTVWKGWGNIIQEPFTGYINPASYYWMEHWGCSNGQPNPWDLHSLRNWCLVLPVTTELAYFAFLIFLSYSAFQHYSLLSLHFTFLPYSSLLQTAEKHSALLYFSTVNFSVTQAVEEKGASIDFYTANKDVHTVCRNRHIYAFSLSLWAHRAQTDAPPLSNG